MNPYQLIPFIGLAPIIIVWLWKRNTKRKKQKEMWEAINEPKIEKIIPIFDENGKPIVVTELLDRIPYFMREEEE